MKKIKSPELQRFQMTPKDALVADLVSEDNFVRESAINRALQLPSEELTTVLKAMPEHNYSLVQEMMWWMGLSVLNLTMFSLLMHALRSGGAGAFGFGTGLLFSLIGSFPALRKARTGSKSTHLRLSFRRKSTCQIFSKMTNSAHVGVLLTLIMKYREAHFNQKGTPEDSSTSLPAWMRFPLYDAMRRLVPELTPTQCSQLTPEQLKALQLSTEVFIDCNEPLVGDILMALAEAGYVKAKPLFKKISKSTGHSQALRDSAIAAAERLEKRLAEIKEVSVLLRPAYFQGDDANLLIPAGNVAQEKASENLMRPVNYKTPETIKSEEARVSS